MSRQAFVREPRPCGTHAVVVATRSVLAARRTSAFDQISENVGAAPTVARDKDEKAEPAA